MFALCAGVVALCAGGPKVVAVRRQMGVVSPHYPRDDPKTYVINKCVVYIYTLPVDLHPIHVCIYLER